jgi:membrane-bound metal-dependent hydrolase YbcI (DUF457 family)
MPFTPYHAGPNGLIGLVLYRWVNLPAIILVNIAMDLEPLVVIVFRINKYPEHGFIHSFGGALIIGLLFAVFYERIKKPIGAAMAAAGLKQGNSLLSIILGSILGSGIHVVLDSFMYRDIMPFYPSDYNPFYGVFTPSEVRILCLICAGISVLIYAGKMIFKTRLKK